MTEIEMHYVTAKRSTLKWSDEKWCWFDRVLSYSELLSPSERCIFFTRVFIFSLQWKFNCCYFSWDNSRLAPSVLERTSLWGKVIEMHATRVSGVISRLSAFCLLMMCLSYVSVPGFVNPMKKNSENWTFAPRTRWTLLGLTYHR